MRKILVIDDDLAVLEVLEEALRYENFDVKVLSETQDIFTVIHDYKPDVILMDYILSGINGGEWCHLIKTDPTSNHIPVIMATAYPRVLNSLGHYGYDAFIEKPFNLSDLILTINACTEKSIKKFAN